MVKNDNQLPGRSLNYHVVNSLFSIHVKLYFKDDIYLAYASIASGFKIVILLWWWKTRIDGHFELSAWVQTIFRTEKMILKECFIQM